MAKPRTQPWDRMPTNYVALEGREKSFVQEARLMPQSFVSLPVHLVFSTKNREPLILDEIQTRLYEYKGGAFHRAAGKARDRIRRALFVGMTGDHVRQPFYRPSRAAGSQPTAAPGY